MMEPEPPHGLVDDLTGVFGAFLGQMKIDHGGLAPGSVGPRAH